MSGATTRASAFSRAIDGARIRATLRNGVLLLELPKLESAKPRRIEIR